MHVETIIMNISSHLNDTYTTYRNSYGRDKIREHFGMQSPVSFIIKKIEIILTRLNFLTMLFVAFNIVK